jgi:hypothetical protein
MTSNLSANQTLLSAHSAADNNFSKKIIFMDVRQTAVSRLRCRTDTLKSENNQNMFLFFAQKMTILILRIFSIPGKFCGPIEFN